MATMNTIETEVELLKREVADMKAIHLRLDAAIEKIADVADVLIYNSKTIHGVLDIDSDVFPKRETKEGRFIAATTLFKW